MNESAVIALGLLFLLIVANGAPVIAALALRRRWAFPVDGGCAFQDGRPWLGPKKTVRGIVASLLFTSVAALALGFSVTTGVLIAAGAMVGDLISSFIKRRLGIPSHGTCLGLDQIPEALIPLLLVEPILDLSLSVILGVLLGFFVIGLLLNQVAERLR